MVRACRIVSMAMVPIILPAAPALADDGGDQAAVIVVTGRGLDDTPAVPAYDVRTIDREALIEAASGRLESALSSVAGFQQFRRSDSRSSNPSAQGVTLRALGGNATSRALVLLDGVPMADPFFGYVPLSALAPERLAAARVTRGGGSGAFGSGAVAGTIELESAGAAELGLLSGQALVDQRGESELSATLAPQLGRGFAVLSGRWDRGKGFWTTPRSQRVPASVRAGYDSWSVALRAVAPLSGDIELQARGLAFDDRRTLRFAGADSTSSGQDASLRLVGRGAWRFDVLGYVEARDFSNIVISSTTFRKSLDQTKTPTLGYGGKAELRPPLGDRHTLRLGVDWRVAQGNTQETAFNATTGAITARRKAGGRNADFGLFVEEDWTLGRMVLTGGLRADRTNIADGSLTVRNAAGAITAENLYADRSDWQVSWRGGMLAHLGGGFDLRAAAYTGLRMPTLNELYRPFTVFPVTTRNNAALGSERLRGFEAGFDFTPAEGIRLSATVFDDKLRDAIANVTIAANTRERRNVDAIHARGVELGADLRLGQIGFAGSLAWTRARVEASGTSVALDGMRPAQTPKLAASGTLAWRSRRGWTLGSTLRHVGAQFEDDLQSDVLCAATTLDAFAEVPVTGGVSVVLRAENLTDTKVITRNQAGSIDLGAPRTVWLGLRLLAGR